MLDEPGVLRVAPYAAPYAGFVLADFVRNNSVTVDIVSNAESALLDRMNRLMLIRTPTPRLLSLGLIVVVLADICAVQACEFVSRSSQRFDLSPAQYLVDIFGAHRLHLIEKLIQAFDDLAVARHYCTSRHCIVSV